MPPELREAQLESGAGFFNFRPGYGGMGGGGPRGHRRGGGGHHGGGDHGHEGEGGGGERRRYKNLDEIQCFKCGENGHFANKCPKGHLAFLSNNGLNRDRPSRDE